MRIAKFTKISEVKSWVSEQKTKGLTVGFVPTMGALHEGHLSLVRTAQGVCDLVIASIFVNPTQFNNPDDLRLYPRTLEKDLSLLESAGCTALFYPEVDEMYPDMQKGHWDFGLITSSLEGEFRPGHFDGVMTIVKKLFEAVPANKAFFGQKDFQQLAVIRHLVKAEHIPIEIVGCPTMRDPDGLAMSSRNTRLTPSSREKALQLSRILFHVRGHKGLSSPQVLEMEGMKALAAIPGVKPEYLRIVESDTFKPVLDWQDASHAVVLLAAEVDGVRLIDNVLL